MNSKHPKSCDTFAVLPPRTAENTVVFGKNSDRPSDEVQEVVYIAAADHSNPKVKCTYIEIDQVPHTYAVILSKPAWMWGAEMGANEHGVCIGNEAVWTKLSGIEDATERLLGMDFLRLGLERATTAANAVEIIVDLLKKYGQGGNCSETLENFTYHNSFLIADPCEVWILETACNLWAAEKIVTGVRNISNELSIRTNIECMSPNAKSFAELSKFWNPAKEDFNFRKAYASEEDEIEGYRYRQGKLLLMKHSQGQQFCETDMFKILRDKDSGICMSFGSFVSTGSQVSVLRKKETGLPCVHWFTATCDPHQSVFKPFIFSEIVEFPLQVISPDKSEDASRKHVLYKSHEEFKKNRKKDMETLRKSKMELESNYVGYVKDIIADYASNKSKAAALFKTAVEDELHLLSDP